MSESTTSIACLFEQADLQKNERNGAGLVEDFDIFVKQNQSFARLLLPHHLNSHF